jgi:hypothetical protein
VKVASIGNVVQAIEGLKKRGFWIVGFDASGTERWDAIDYRRPIALVLGGEGRGIRRLVREHCDHLVSIPLFGHVGSLNVSVAAGIALYEAVRQRGAVPSHVRPIPVRATAGSHIVGPGAEDGETDPGLAARHVTHDDEEEEAAVARGAGRSRRGRRPSGLVGAHGAQAGERSAPRAGAGREHGRGRHGGRARAWPSPRSGIASPGPGGRRRAAIAEGARDRDGRARTAEARTERTAPSGGARRRGRPAARRARRSRPGGNGPRPSRRASRGRPPEGARAPGASPSRRGPGPAGGGKGVSSAAALAGGLDVIRDEGLQERARKTPPGT